MKLAILDDYQNAALGSADWGLLGPDIEPTVFDTHLGHDEACGADADRYGVASIGVHGEWFVAASVVRDLAALNKREMLPFDYWGMAVDFCLSMRMSDGQRTVIDRLAAMTADDGFDFLAMREAYESDEAIRVTDPVKSWPKGVETDFTVGLA